MFNKILQAISIGLKRVGDAPASGNEYNMYHKSPVAIVSEIGRLYIDFSRGKVSKNQIKSTLRMLCDKFGEDTVRQAVDSFFSFYSDMDSSELEESTQLMAKETDQRFTKLLDEALDDTGVDDFIIKTKPPVKIKPEIPPLSVEDIALESELRDAFTQKAGELFPGYHMDEEKVKAFSRYTEPITFILENEKEKKLMMVYIIIHTAEFRSLSKMKNLKGRLQYKYPDKHIRGIIIAENFHCILHNIIQHYTQDDEIYARKYTLPFTLSELEPINY